MKNIIRLLALIAFGATLAHAQGACPASAVITGNNCYFVAATGSDSLYDGTTEAISGSHGPWLHAPGMPNCASNCLTVYNTWHGGGGPWPVHGQGMIFRGGDTWHEGNSGASPYTGGTFEIDFTGDPSNCVYEGTQTGCFYVGVDTTWYNSSICGASWCRPILNQDNALSGSLVSSCSYQTGTHNQMFLIGASSYATYFDSFELTGYCVQGIDAQSGMIADGGNGSNGINTQANFYAHGWTVTTGAATSSVPCMVLNEGPNSQEVLDRIVIDGSDSLPSACAWGVFPTFYHFRDSMIRYTTQGVGTNCHDIHDNIFEHFYNPYVPTHGNVLECNTDQSGSTPNVWYNNTLRDEDSSWNGSGNPQWWVCPNTTPEYWFNNIQYNITTAQNWDIAGPPGYPSCDNSGGQFMFNNTFVDVAQPCYLSNLTQGGQYLTVLNEHLINSPIDSGTTPCTGVASATNVTMSDATAISQGYMQSGGGTIQTNTCANATTPCAPVSAGNSTVGAGANEQAFCTALAAYISEPAIGTDAANACKYGTTDGCAYITATHSMSCPANVAIARPASAAWDSGAYQFTVLSSPTPSNAPQFFSDLFKDILRN